MDMLADTPLGAIVPGVRPRLESGVFDPRFKLSLAEKDLRLVLEVCERQGLSPRLAASVREWFRHAAEAGLADRDYTAVAAHIADQTAGPER
jgi:3-hydroxyisobutyrate dehydrogenase-like beta-hydroxyacid dehydrogenase